jgi:hypothetical protein
MFRDRFLTGILIGIGVLVVLALILFFIRQGSSQYVDESTPAGVLQNYFLALQKQDYQRAYNYLADTNAKPTLEYFRGQFQSYQGQNVADTTAEISDATVDAQIETATVQVVLMQGNPGLFGSVYRNQQTAFLIRQNGVWKISNAPFPFWVPEPPYEAPQKLEPSPTPLPTSTPS